MRNKLFLSFGALACATAAHAMCTESQIAQYSHELITQVRPIYDTLRNYGPVPALNAGFHANGDYMTRAGLLMDHACFAGQDTAARRKAADDFEKTAREMLEGADRCGRHRLLSFVERQFYDVLNRRPRVTCDPNDCSAGAAACAAHGSNRLNLKTADSHGDAGIWFHELLHLTSADNQPTEDHNRHVDDTDRVDEVVFWQRHCFNPGRIVADMRNGHPEACDAALAHRGVANRWGYNAREQGLVCGLYRSYIAQEDNFRRGVLNELVPEVFRCVPGIDGECPDAVALNTELARNSVLANYQLPTADNWEQWMHANCPTVGARSPDDIGACVKRISRNFSNVVMMESVASGFVLPPGVETRVERAWQRLAEKADFVAFVGDTSHTIADAQSHTENRMTRAVDTCANSSIAGSSLCRSFNTTMSRPLAGLLHYWW